MNNFWRNLSLRTRLTALSVGLLGTLLGAFGGVLYVNLRRFLMNSTALRQRAQAKPIIDRQLAQAGRGDLKSIATELSQALTSRDTSATIFDREGNRLADGRRLSEEPVSAEPREPLLRRAASGEKEITYITTQLKQRSLVALIPLHPTPGSPEVMGVAQLTTPLSATDHLLARQRQMMGVGLVLTLGLGILGEMWLTKTSLAPLKRIIATIRELAGGNLSRRVQLPHSRDEVGELGAVFDTMAGNLEQAFTSQARFVTAAAHELRTPLAALQGSLEVLQRGSQDDPAAARTLLQGMHREVSRMGRLTEQLLALTRLDAPEAMHPAWVDLDAFFNQAIQPIQYITGGRQFTVVRGMDAKVYADADHLTQLLLNLVDNAVQHTDPGDRIELGWSLQEASVILWVADSGKGIAPADLPHIFEAFYRGDRSRSRQQGGAGLGLAIVASIVHSQGGVIKVDSQLGQGTRFTISLPYPGESF